MIKRRDPTPKFELNVLTPRNRGKSFKDNLQHGHRRSASRLVAQSRAPKTAADSWGTARTVWRSLHAKAVVESICPSPAPENDEELYEDEEPVAAIGSVRFKDETGSDDGDKAVSPSLPLASLLQTPQSESDDSPANIEVQCLTPRHRGKSFKQFKEKHVFKDSSAARSGVEHWKTANTVVRTLHAKNVVSTICSNPSAQDSSKDQPQHEMASQHSRQLHHASNELQVDAKRRNSSHLGTSNRRKAADSRRQSEASEMLVGHSSSEPRNRRRASRHKAAAQVGIRHGTLHLEVVSARHLASRCGGSHVPSAYVSMVVGTRRFDTTVVAHKCDPVWDSSHSRNVVSFPIVPDDQHRCLTLSVLDAASVPPGASLGTVEVDIRQLLVNQVDRRLEHLNGSRQATLDFAVQFEEVVVEEEDIGGSSLASSWDVKLPGVIKQLEGLGHIDEEATVSSEDIATTGECPISSQLADNLRNMVSRLRRAEQLRSCISRRISQITELNGAAEKATNADVARARESENTESMPSSGARVLLTPNIKEAASREMDAEEAGLRKLSPGGVAIRRRISLIELPSAVEEEISCTKDQEVSVELFPMSAKQTSKEIAALAVGSAPTGASNAGRSARGVVRPPKPLYRRNSMEQSLESLEMVMGNANEQTSGGKRGGGVEDRQAGASPRRARKRDKKKVTSDDQGAHYDHHERMDHVGGFGELTDHFNDGLDGEGTRDIIPDTFKQSQCAAPTRRVPTRSEFLRQAVAAKWTPSACNLDVNSDEEEDVNTRRLRQLERNISSVRATGDVAVVAAECLLEESNPDAQAEIDELHNVQAELAGLMTKVSSESPGELDSLVREFIDGSWEAELREKWNGLSDKVHSRFDTVMMRIEGVEPTQPRQPDLSSRAHLWKVDGVEAPRLQVPWGMSRLNSLHDAHKESFSSTLVVLEDRHVSSALGGQVSEEKTMQKHGASKTELPFFRKGISGWVCAPRLAPTEASGNRGRSDRSAGKLRTQLPQLGRESPRSPAPVRVELAEQPWLPPLVGQPSVYDGVAPLM